VSRQSVRGQLTRELERARALVKEDRPLEAARITQAMIEDMASFEAEFAEVRRSAFRSMCEAFGWSYGDIAREFPGRMTRQRVSQIVNG
jgi:hypothetical protein